MAHQNGEPRPSTVSGINRLPFPKKREIYAELVPNEIIDLFHLNPYLYDPSGRSLLRIHCSEDSPAVEVELRHRFDFPDPVVYGHIADNLHGQFHILLYVINDPHSPRYDIDHLPDGTTTNLGADRRNLEAEQAALKDGLAPGQIRRGLRMLGPAARTFEAFVKGLGHTIYFAEPLYYHNALLFERMGFAYQKGRALVNRIQTGFSPGGDLLARLDGSTPFRQPGAAESIRLRSWAIHDGILGEPFNDVTMYKLVDKHAGIVSCPDCDW